MIKFAPEIGMITIFAGFLLLGLSFLPLISRRELDGGLRLVSIIMSFGGLLCIWSGHMDMAIARHAFVVVGMVLILSSAGIAADLRPQKAKRKVKPKLH
mgnify:CR=1 FL=1